MGGFSIFHWIIFVAVLALIAAVAFHAMRLIRDPSSRTIGRVLFVGIFGSLFLAMLFIGVTQ